MDKSAQRYLKRLRRGLVCSREDRERLLADAGFMLENFAQENPRAFYKDYVASFGPPEDFAAQMLSNLDPEDVAEIRSRRKRALFGIVATALVVLILLAGFWFGRQSQSQPVAGPSGPEISPTALHTPEPTAGETETPGPGTDQLEQLYVDSDEITFKRAVEVMTELGVMSGNDEGMFYPKDPVTRGQAAKFISVMLTGGKELTLSAGTEAGFSDTQGHWAEGYIAYCREMGVIDGQDGDAFDPNGSVTGVEFAKMALAALGYDPVAYQLTGPAWDFSTNRLAAQVCQPSLYEGLLDANVVVSDPLTREEAAQILYNMLSNTVIMATPTRVESTGEVTFRYAPGKDKNGQNITFLSLHFPDKELGE